MGVVGRQPTIDTDVFGRILVLMGTRVGQLRHVATKYKAETGEDLQELLVEPDVWTEIAREVRGWSKMGGKWLILDGICVYHR